MFTQISFDTEILLFQVTIVGGGDGKCLAEMKVLPEHLNRGGGLHGGLSSTIVDVSRLILAIRSTHKKFSNIFQVATTYALMTNDVENIKAGVSVDLHVTFMKAAKENDEIVIDARTIKRGRTLAFLECEIRNKKCNSVLVKGSHTKFIGL